MKPLYKYYPLFIILMVVAIVSTAFYGATVVRALFYERITSGLEDTATMVKKLLIDDSPTDLDLFCKTIGTPYSRITVTNKNGEVIGDSEADLASMNNHGDRPEIKRAYLGVTGTSIRYSDTLKRNMVYIALPEFSLTGESVVLRTATPLRSLSSDLRGAYFKISIVGAIILILVSVLGYLFTARVNGALQIIRQAVNEYAKGNLSFRPHVYRPPELKRVAETISNLSKDLLAQAAEAAKQRDALEAVFAGMEEAVVVLDPDLVIQELNASALALTDFSQNETIGKDLLLIFRNSNLYEVARRAQSEEQGVEGDIVYFGDRQRHLQIRASLIRGTEDGGDDRIVVVMNDVTRLKNLEQIRKDFVANVSHELKTPITAVKGYVETLIEGDYQNPDTSKKFLTITLNHVDRLSAIVEDLLIISRLEQNADSRPEVSACYAGDAIKAVVTIYQIRAEQKELDLAVECPPALRVNANPVLLEQALGNLVDNAIKYSATGGRIEISASRQHDLVLFSVKDQGSGIEVEHLNRIFERFYRVDKGRSRDIGGTGLGLSIVKHIALSHGGSVAVKSAEGEGSTFTINIPG